MKYVRLLAYCFAIISLFPYCVRGGGNDWEVLGQWDLVIDYGLRAVDESEETSWS